MGKPSALVSLGLRDIELSVPPSVVRQLANGSDLERALALLITQRRSEDRSFTAALEKK
jgi:hypothetical protein